MDHNDSDYINIIDDGDADYVKGLQTVSRHKVLALQVTPVSSGSEKEKRDRTK